MRIIFHLIKGAKNKIVVSSNEAVLYEYVDIKRNDFTGNISLENDKIVKITSDEFKPYEGSIIYYAESERLIIPKTSAIVFYYRDNLTFKLNKYSEVYFDNNSTVVVSEGKKIASGNFFIYDGEDTYIIPINSTLKVNGNEISLSAGSYIIASPDNLIYYDYVLNTINKVEGINNASLKIGNAQIDLLKDVTVYNNKVVLIEQTIDDMGIYKED